MESSDDKQWASKYLLDPLNAPQPADETGPGSSSTFVSPSQTVSATTPNKLQKNHSIRSSAPTSEGKPTPSVSVRSNNNPYRNGTSEYPTPPHSASPRKSRFSNETFPDFDGAYLPNRQSITSTQIPTSTGGHGSSTTGGRQRRSSSLRERYPGDHTGRPLDMLKKDAKAANRSPHLRKKHQPGADSIDKLDDLFPTGAYHHEGPYDATLLARNTSHRDSPVEAVSTVNEEALKATPREMVKDSVEKHRPLDGTAMIPPGMRDRYGNKYEYEEGTDMMRANNPEGGAYRRWPDMKYLPEDLKGKGEPSYTVEKALKGHKANSHGRHVSESGIEMTSPAEHRRPISVEGAAAARPVSTDGGRPTGEAMAYADWDREGHVRRSSSGAGKLRKRFGSLRVGRKD